MTLLCILRRLLVGLFELFEVESEQPVAAPAESQDRHKQSATSTLHHLAKRAFLSVFTIFLFFIKNASLNFAQQVYSASVIS